MPRRLFACVLLVGFACRDPVAPSPVGKWGGNAIALTVSATGGSVEYDCAAGAILEAIVVDVDGRFDARGSFTPGHGGPVLIGEVFPQYPARYAGRIVGDVMSLTVTRTDTARTVGAFALQRGSPGRLVRCY